MSTFQIVLLCIFGILLVIGVLFFATGNLGNQQAALPTLLMWGTIPSDSIKGLLQQLDDNQRGILHISYVEQVPATFDRDFSDAIAEGRGPDIVILPQDEILAERNKLTPIPFTTLPEREFKDTFIEEGDLFKTSKGYLAIPFTIDPLVMYWNKSVFQSAGIATPPKYWDEFNGLTSTLTKKDQYSNILKSAISFGEFGNVANAKAILSSLIFQIGNPITAPDQSNPNNPDQVAVVLNDKVGSAGLLAGSALDFFTQFGDPAKSIFSWDRALPLSTNAFLSGDLATYFGFASELGALNEKNPNLNFDVAVLPQPRNAATKMTFGTMTGLALVRGSKHVDQSYNSIRILTSASSLSILSKLTRLPSTRIDILGKATPDDAALAVFNQAALQSRAWLDPDPVATNKIFSDMIESIKSGDQKTSEAVNAASTKIQNLMR